MNYKDEKDSFNPFVGADRWDGRAGTVVVLQEFLVTDWKAPSYVIGTYHLAPVSFTDSIPGLKAALNAAEQVYGKSTWKR